MATMKDLLDQLAEAQVAGDVSRIVEVAKAIGAKEKDEKKAKVEAQKAEVEALYGKVQEAVLKIADKYAAEFEELGIRGFGYKVEGRGFSWQGPKASSGGGGGGGAGKCKAATGMSLQEVFDAYANDTERRKMEGLETGNAKWSLKEAVRKRAASEGLIPDYA